MDCEDCRHLTVVGLHDTGPWNCASQCDHCYNYHCHFFHYGQCTDQSVSFLQVLRIAAISFTLKVGKLELLTGRHCLQGLPVEHAVYRYKSVKYTTTAGGCHHWRLAPSDSAKRGDDGPTRTAGKGRGKELLEPGIGDENYFRLDVLNVCNVSSEIFSLLHQA